jgi:hypothetical protein
VRQLQLYPLLLVACVVPLGGCHSFLGIHLSRNSVTPLPTEEPVLAARVVPGAKTSVGREQLASGQVGLAIETFLQALSAGEARAPATNGLGVAYARLGRYDLARRYFEEAVAIDGADPRYANNLALAALSEDSERDKASQLALERKASIAVEAYPSGTLQRVSQWESRIASAAPPEPVKRSAEILIRSHPTQSGQFVAASHTNIAPSPVFRRSASDALANAKSGTPTQGLIQRLSRREVHIATVVARPALVRPGLAVVDKSFRPLVRIALDEPAKVARRSFIRFALPESRPFSPARAASGTKSGAPGAKS